MQRFLMGMLRRTVNSYPSQVRHELVINKWNHSADWVVDKGNIMNNNGELGLLLTQTNGGTRISSTRYVHYGTITATRTFILFLAFYRQAISLASVSVSAPHSLIFPLSSFCAQSKAADGVEL
jgi:hypothetical protein